MRILNKIAIQVRPTASDRLARNQHFKKNFPHQRQISKKTFLIGASQCFINNLSCFFASDPLMASISIEGKQETHDTTNQYRNRLHPKMEIEGKENVSGVDALVRISCYDMYEFNVMGQ